MSELYQRSLTKLELHLVLEQLAACAHSSEGKRRCLLLEPSADIEDVRSLQVLPIFKTFQNPWSVRIGEERCSLWNCFVLPAYFGLQEQ